MKTRCSESYELSSGTYKLFGMTIWRSINSPRVVIQSGVVPGECWCFKGSEGRLAIHLSARIIPTAFTYEHIPVELSRDGHIKSAPNHFIVYGLRYDNDLDPIILGDYYYQIDGGGTTPLQRFTVQNTE
ncbi:SUN domain-containing protein 1-like protein, partial [Euroglyphus maynei]